MKALKFTLSGRSAFFKIPEVNSYLYYTYGHIHRVALLGVLGAILGCKGYSYKRKEYPEFYGRLKELEISILPNTINGVFPKKLQVFNNSTGFASYETGGNLVVKQVWLEDASWDIYIKLNSEVSNELAKMMLDSRAIYIPYLGSNDHLADIKNVEVVDLKKVDSKQIDSLIKKDNVNNLEMKRKDFKYEEYLPYKLEKNSERHITCQMMFTNGKVDTDLEVYSFNDKNMVFCGEE